MIRSAVMKGDCIDAARTYLDGKSAVVVGLGRTGISVSRFLRGSGARVVATDSKDAGKIEGADSLLSMGVEVRAGGHDGVGLDGVDLVVVSPGVPSDLPLLERARENGAEVISEIELAWRFMDAPVLAIAGTNGKTTATALLGEVMKKAGFSAFVGGNIGTPAIEYVEKNGGADFVVLEVSSFQLETTRHFRPRVGALLNITDDHLDRYRDFGHYAETKMRLFENQAAGDFAVYNANDPAITQRARLLGHGRAVPFTIEGRVDKGLFLDGGSIVFRHDGGTEEYPVSGVKLKGLHNIENVMAVIASARLSGAERDAVLEALSSFAGLHHRMEVVRETGGVTYVDDSKGTNVGALMMALKGLKGPVVLIAGGVDKGGDYGVLAGLVKEKVKLMVLIGEARPKIEKALGGCCRTVLAESFEEAVRTAHKNALPGDTVLLSPACSSFDMFRDYKERGERFRSLVEAL